MKQSLVLRQYQMLGFLLAVNALGISLNSSLASASVLLRVENFTVTPSTGPVTHVRVQNTSDTAETVTIQPEFPDGWRWTPKQRSITLKPHQLERLPFAIEKAVDLKSNRYPVEVVLKTDTDRTVHQQTVVCASAPYFQPKIDGRFKDWSEAIPVSFTSAGRKTVVSTYWNPRYFCVYVQVEEDELRSYKKGQAVMDAVQFALAPGQSVTASVGSAPAQRYEFLVVNASGMFAKDRCFRLIKAGTDLSVTQQQRSLESLAFREAQVVVKRQGRITHYECAIPWSALPSIRADVGREISLSFLIHDPDGTGLRDWGKSSGLWAEQRNRLAWCAWDVPFESADIPYDSKVEWGLCSSKH